MFNIYFYLNQKENKFYIKRTNDIDKNLELVIKLENTTYEHAKNIITAAILSFNIGQLLEKNANLCIDEDIGCIYLRDVDGLPFKEIYANLPISEQKEINDLQFLNTNGIEDMGISNIFIN